MTPQPGPRVWMQCLLRGAVALVLAVAAIVAVGTSVASAQVAGVAIPAMGRPPLLDDDPAHVPAVATPRPGADDDSACPAVEAAARTSGTGHHSHATADAAPAVCTTPTPAPPALTPVPVPTPSPPRTAAAPVSTPRPAAAAVATPTPTPRPRAVLPLPVLPPLWLTPSVMPVPQAYGTQLAPTSVLALGFGSVALATAAMTLRLLRRGR